MDIREKLKPVERSMNTLKKHIKTTFVSSTKGKSRDGKRANPVYGGDDEQQDHNHDKSMESGNMDTQDVGYLSIPAPLPLF